MTTEKTHILSDETGLLLLAQLQIIASSETSKFDTATGNAAAALASTALTIQEAEYDRQLLLGIYPGRNLATVFADEIADYASDAEWFNHRVITGDFAGIRIFDYFDITLTDGKVFRYRVAAIDPYLHCGDTEKTAHHVVMVPDQVWPDSVLWNTTNTNQGNSTTNAPYIVSNLHNWEINTFFPLLPTKWKSVICAHRALLENRYASGSTLNASTGWAWYDMGKIWSLSEFEVYGEVTWGTPGYSQGFDCHFAEFFKSTAHRIRRNPSGDRYTWWLRSAHGSSSSHVCYVSNHGAASHYAATHSWVRPLPCFLVGV